MARGKRDPRREPAASAREARAAAPGRAARTAAAESGPWSRLPAWTAVALIAADRRPGGSRAPRAAAEEGHHGQG